MIDEIYTNAFGMESRAQDLYLSACLRGWVSQAKSLLTKKQNKLLDIASLTGEKKVMGGHYQGRKMVAIDKIKGSEGRCDDFDGEFHPLKHHNRNRWVGIACAFEQGIALPPVDLIKVGDVYVVRDGHHRISVAKAYGAGSLDAEVMVLNISA